MNTDRVKPGSPGLSSTRTLRHKIRSRPLLSKRNNCKSSRALNLLSPSSRSEPSITPELAAMVVQQYLLPLFESENRSKKGLFPGFSEFRDELNRPLEVVSNTVYGELKLVDSLLKEYNEVKKELEQVSQELNDTEQEKAGVLSELDYVKRHYAEVSSEMDLLQLEVQNALREEQQEELKVAFLNNQLAEYKKLYAQSEAENKQFISDLHEEKALNDKRRNMSVELEHGNELLRMENDIMAERLSDLYAQFNSLGDRRLVEDKLVTETDYLANALKELAGFCHGLSAQLVEAVSEREQLKSQQEEIEALTEEIKSVRDRLVNYSKEAISNLQGELGTLVEQREEYKVKQAKLEKNYRDLAEAYEKLRSRLKQWKQRGRNYKEHEEKICAKCRQAYVERENFNWSCKTHAGTYSANTDIWWCCGRKSKDAPGCLPSKHISKEEEEEDDQEDYGNRGKEEHLGYYNVLCSSCKEVGHKPHECPKDPNVRSATDPIEDGDRVTEIRNRKKANVNNIEVSQKMMGLLEAKFGECGFGDTHSDSEPEPDAQKENCSL